MPGGTDLELFREMFKDKRIHIAIAQIQKLSLVPDRSSLNAFVSVWPEERTIVAKMSWEAVGSDGGFFFFPQPGDLVLLGMAEGDDDDAFIIKRLTSSQDTIPENATGGDFVLKALPEKRGWITAVKLFLTKGNSVPTENLVLGQQLKTLLGDILLKLNELSTKVSEHTHIGNLGYPTSAPNEASEFVQFASDFSDLKDSPVDDELILSDVAFTEKGS